MYKTLGFMWLSQASCHASIFVTVDRDKAPNPNVSFMKSLPVMLKDNSTTIKRQRK
jgi:hypothetical protein